MLVGKVDGDRDGQSRSRRDGRRIRIRRLPSFRLRLSCTIYFELDFLPRPCCRGSRRRGRCRSHAAVADVRTPLPAVPLLSLLFTLGTFLGYSPPCGSPTTNPVRAWMAELVLRNTPNFSVALSAFWNASMAEGSALFAAKVYPAEMELLASLSCTCTFCAD